MKILNVLQQAANPKRFRTIARKLLLRVADSRGQLSTAQNAKWIRENCKSFESFAKRRDPALWQESVIKAKDLEQRASSVLQAIPYNLGGGGVYPFLYFLTRLIKPSVIVETGVAAGYSSYSFLSAIRANGRGKLFSSDFPYFRLPHPEQYIGIIVEQELRVDWALYIDGDDLNLPRILAQIERIDLFHYDSDKSYAGRRSALALSEAKLSESAVVLMDDIQDNSFFHDYVVARKVRDWAVFEFQGKFVGVIGLSFGEQENYVAGERSGGA